MSLNLRCFVATAFDHADVDAIYGCVIKRALRALNIVPLRVDRVQHNDDIDDKIFQLIHQCDLCIADLTYARPSVYYEAGYAFGLGKPVIYIARYDHLAPNANDINGNLRVHFDLQMKNIITWRKPTDGLRNKIIQRLRHVIRPLLENRKIDEAKLVEERKFSQRAPNYRIQIMSTKAVSLLRSRGFKFRFGKRRHNERFMAFRISGRNVKEIRFRCVNRLSKNVVEWDWMTTELAEKDLPRNPTISLSSIYVTLQRVTRPALESYFPSYNHIADNTLFRKGFDDFKEVPLNKRITILPYPKSESDFTTRFKEIIDSFPES